MFPACRPQLRHRLNRADLVVGRHDGDKDGVWAQGFFQRIRPDDAFPIHWKYRKLEPFFPGQVFTAMKHSMMFYCASDKVASLWFEQPRGSEDCQVRALRATAGKDNFTRFAAQEGCRAVPRIIKDGTGLSSDMMDTRRVAPNLAQIWQHSLSNLRVQRRGRVVVEIDGVHDPSFRGSPVEAGP